MQYIFEFFGILTSSLLVTSLAGAMFFGAAVYIWYKLRVHAKQVAYGKSLKFIYLEAKIDQLNERSPLAMEQIFASLHAIYSGFSWGEKFNGKFVSSTTCELVSLGGRVSYIFKIQDRYRNLLESAIFAQYPKAEIIEVEDYLKHLPRFYNPETAEFDFWGTQLNKRLDVSKSCYPIRTYGAFEHTEQETIIDPLSSVIEVMSNLQPYELMVSQIVFKPVDESWKKKTEEILRGLRGNPKKKSKPGILDGLLTIPMTIIHELVGIVFPKGEPVKPERAKEEPPSMIQHLSEGQKNVLAGIEHQLSKISYEAKIRLFYLAPKGKLNKSLRIPEIIGAYRNFDDPSMNGLKPDLKKTWTGVSYKYFESLEKPWRDSQELTRKRKFLIAFKDRDHFKGSGKCYYNSEEMATLFHFPQSPNARVSQVEKVETVKTAPPSNLPVSDIGPL